ncbi:uncharacterized protein LOC144060471 [Vanacampus margaritifer]
MKYLNVQGKPHLCLFATQDIDSGEEITYNYGDSDWPWRSKESGQQNTSTSKLTMEETTSTAPTDALKSFQERSAAEKSAQPSGVEHIEQYSDTERPAQPQEVEDIEQHSGTERSPQPSEVEDIEQHCDTERSAQPSEVDDIE